MTLGTRKLGDVYATFLCSSVATIIETVGSRVCPAIGYLQCLELILVVVSYWVGELYHPWRIF